MDAMVVGIDVSKDRPLFGAYLLNTNLELRHARRAVPAAFPPYPNRVHLDSRKIQAYLLS
jgi:hypothetical protein